MLTVLHVITLTQKILLIVRTWNNRLAPIGKGVHQGCILSPRVFNLYAEYIMRNARLEEAQARIKMAGSPGISLEGMRLKLKLQYFGHLMRRVDSLEKTLMLGGIGSKSRRGRQRMKWHH